MEFQPETRLWEYPIVRRTTTGKYGSPGSAAGSFKGPIRETSARNDTNLAGSASW